MIPTWREIQIKLQELNIDPRVQERIRILTGPERHKARCEAAWQAALQWCHDDPVRAAALCFCEHRGLCGGGLQCPGAGTTRHEAFRRLGKGRRQASDGGVWTDAIYKAPGLHGYSCLSWLPDEATLFMELATPVGQLKVNLDEILQWWELEVLVLGLIQDKYLDPVEASVILDWCQRCSDQEAEHENQTCQRP